MAVRCHRAPRRLHFLMILSCFAVASIAAAAPFNAFGPKQYTRAAGEPAPVTSQFTVRNPAARYSIAIENNGVSSAIVTLNGVEIFGPNDFKQHALTLSKEVTVAAQNTLIVELRGQPNESLLLRVVGNDEDLPSIAAAAAPPPNAAGWNNGNVTVSFACGDATSGIASCPPPVVAALEGADQIISGTAYDVAGNSATASVTLDIDRTAPAIAILSPEEGATVTGLQATVTGKVIDALSGVTAIACNGTPAPLANGQFTCTVGVIAGENVLSFAATDAAGNRGTASRTVHVSVSPVVRITEPASFAFVNISPITVRGTVSDRSATVTVGGIATPLTNGSFSVQVPLVEGNNNITAVAEIASGEAGVGSVQVTLDTTPPHVTIYSPADGATTTDASITISGLVNDIVVGTVNDVQAQVTVNGVSASVANRSFIAANVPLSIGDNLIRATGRDRVGNAYTAQITVRRAPAAGARIMPVSGDAQTAAIGMLLPQPLTVRLVNAAGQPVANQSVVFRVVQSDGTLGDVSGSSAGRNSVALTTDANGLARVNYRLGTRAGAGNNRVEATATGFGGTASFVVSAIAGIPARVNVDAGVGQTGTTAQPLTFPFVVVVTDAGNNRLAHVPVTFRVREGGGSFAGVDATTGTTDSDGRALAILTLGPQPGYDNNVVEATVSGAGTPAVFSASAKTGGNVADTRISGVVLDNGNLPLPGATLRLYRAYQASNSNIPVPVGQTVVSDAQGRFVMTSVPVGAFKLVADGTTIQRPGVAYPSVEYDIVTVAGQDNNVGMPVYLPALDTVNRLCVDETIGGTLTLPSVPGFSFTVAAGSATFPGGSRSGCITVTPVHGDKVPMVPGFGQQPRFVITIQPAGTHFNPPAQIAFPNVDGLAPRQVTEMYSYDHDLSAFVAIGTATVSADGAVIRSDPGVGVLKAGWHCGGNPNPTGTAATCKECWKCSGQSCARDSGQNTRTCQNNVCKQCNDGNCVDRPSSSQLRSLATVTARLGAQIPPYRPTSQALFADTINEWGLTFPERINPTITARCDGPVWRAELTEIVGDYSMFARLVVNPPPQRPLQEVTGPGGNTDQQNFCEQVNDLANSVAVRHVWYMVQAVINHEKVHQAHLEPTLRDSVPEIEPLFTALTVPTAPGKTEAMAIAEIEASRDYEDARDQAWLIWLKKMAEQGDIDHSGGHGEAFRAEFLVTEPMIRTICLHSKAQGWPACAPICDYY